MIRRKRLYTSYLTNGRSGGIITGLLIFMTILLSLSSCIKEEFNSEQLNTHLQINPGIAAPIGWARYQMDEMLDSSLNSDELYIDENGFMYLVYSMDPYTIMANEIIDIQNLQPTVSSIDNPFGERTDLALLDSAYTFKTSLAFNLPISGTSNAEIDSILLRDGVMTISISSPYDQLFWDARISIEGIPGSVAGFNDEANSVTDTLDGITLPLDNTPPNSNALKFNITVTLWDTLAVIDPGPILNINISLMNLDYSAIYGYLGNFDIDIGPETFPLDFHNDLGGGSFTFSDPRLNIRFQNSFGLPIEMDMTDFYATGSGGQTYPIEPTGGESFIKKIDYPQPGEEGLLSADSLIMDKTNSTLVTVVSEPLSTFTAHISGRSNPEGPPKDNFILDTSRLSVSADLILPLSGTSDTILVSDTLRFVFREYFDNPPEEILRLMFRVTYITQFPVDVKTQVYFLGEDPDAPPLEVLFDSDDERRIIKGTTETDENGIAIPIRNGCPGG